MELTQAQVTRFYETLAKLIGEREGVEIRVVSVKPKEEMDSRQQDEEICNCTQERKAV